MSDLRSAAAPSIGDVARLAGVSGQTVSRVSMGHTNVRAATREKVLAAMEQLGYVPNHAARSLRRGRFGTIGLIAHRLSRTGESLTVDGVVEAARQRGSSVTLVDLDAPTEEEMGNAVYRLRNQAVDGLIVIRAEGATPETLQLPQRLPVVVSDSRFRGHLPAVGSAEADGARAAVEHLLSLGHRTVHHVSGPMDSEPSLIRLEAWRATLTAAGCEVPAVIPGDWSAESGYSAGRLLAGNRDVTAVLCANDETAIGLMRAMHSAGRRVPDDISVVGFDGLSISAQVWPPLTTVRQDFAEIGRRLVDLLWRQVEGGEDLTDVHEAIPVELVIRESTAPPPSH